MLTGSFEHALDPKKRLTVPSSWRKYLKPYMLVVPSGMGGQNHLLLVPATEMEAKIEECRRKELFNREARALLSAFEMVDQCEADGQGRIRISDKLLRFAGLTDGVILKGEMRMAKLSPATKDGGVDEVRPVDDDFEDAGF